MRLKNITMTGVILLVLAFTVSMAGAIENGTVNETPMVNVTGTPTETLTGTTTATPESDDNEESDTGIFGPGHLLYRLKIEFENMGETFTFNSSEKLGKQISNARHRINEYRKALKQNDTKAADMALAQYEDKMNEVNASISGLSDKDTGYINAKQMILKHQFILENLSISHPDNKGLQMAFNNSKKLQTNFESKMDKKSGSSIEIENQERTKAAEKAPMREKEEKSEKGMKN